MAEPQIQSIPTLGSSLIPVINKLQDICAQSGIPNAIDLPQVAVVGSQSSGKSSVLEALVGRDFLPRGMDVCTRRPMVLQLIRENKGGEEYGEFLHLPGKKFFDFLEIRDEIQAETEREAGENKGISDRPIRLKIHSPNVVDLTFVDLPGITKVPVGDQPSDIESRIRSMILSYIKIPSCLILAIAPANSDLANSNALQIAGNVDPDGRRTIGIITKLDIMDRGTDARDLLLGKVIPLRHGYIGVVNRSQEDIMLGRSIKEALAAEEKFFHSHPIYVNLADRCGIPQLAKKLNKILGKHIQEYLPEMKSRISSQLVAVTKEYASYGEITESKTGKGTLLLNILSKYSEAFTSLVDGKSQEMSTSELSGGARIRFIFQAIFVKRLEEVDPCEGLTDDDIRTAIQNARGPRSALFVPVVPFEVLVRRQIARLLDPSVQCAAFIYNELVKISHNSVVSELQRYPVLRKRVDEVIGEFLRGNLEPAESIIRHIIEMQMDYINTSHPNFIGGIKALEVASQQTRSHWVTVPRPRQSDGVESDTSQASGSSRSRAIIVRPPSNDGIRSVANGALADQGGRSNADLERSHATAASMWGISSIFSGGSNRSSSGEAHRSSFNTEPVHSGEHASTIIQLREPPTILRSSEIPSEQEATEVAATKLLLSSYFDIVRKIIEDFVPKAIMHFLVNHTKREVHNVLIEKLYRENLFDEILQEPEEVAAKRKHARATLRILQQAFKTLDELPLEVDAVGKGYSLGSDPIGLPRNHYLPSSSGYSGISSSFDSL
ncbi:hypothetical protein Droror1_Dr00011035 [Drosera rotundifolia]